VLGSQTIKANKEEALDCGSALEETQADETFAKTLVNRNKNLRILVQNLFTMVPKVKIGDDDGASLMRSLSIDQELDRPINQNMYFAFSAHLFKRLVPNANASQCERLLRAQWELDTATADIDNTLAFTAFKKCMVMIMEQWCRSPDQEDYFTFVRDVLTPAFFNVSNRDPTKPFNFLRLFGEKEKKVEAPRYAPLPPPPPAVKIVYKPLSKRLQELSKPKVDLHDVTHESTVSCENAFAVKHTPTIEMIVAELDSESSESSKEDTPGTAESRRSSVCKIRRKSSSVSVNNTFLCTPVAEALTPRPRTPRYGPTQSQS